MGELHTNSILDTSVLVLNRSYMAVRVVSVRRAFIMLYRDAAEVIHIEDGGYATYDFTAWCEMSEIWREGMSQDTSAQALDWVRTVRSAIRAPRIIRLLRFDRTPRLAVRLNRRNVFARDGHCCQYCGRSFPNNQLSFDHVKPRSRGGQTSWDNVVTCCLACNSRKGDRTPQEAGMRLQSRPLQPKHNPVLTVKMGHPRYHVWLPFVGTSSSAIEVV